MASYIGSAIYYLNTEPISSGRHVTSNIEHSLKKVSDGFIVLRMKKKLALDSVRAIKFEIVEAKFAECFILNKCVTGLKYNGFKIVVASF